MLDIKPNTGRRSRCVSVLDPRRISGSSRDPPTKPGRCRGCLRGARCGEGALIAGGGHAEPGGEGAGVRSRGRRQGVGAQGAGTSASDD